MTTDSPSLGPQRRLPAQFSLATIFIITAAVAFVLGIVLVFPDWVAGIAILFLIFLVPAALLIAAQYGPGAWTAFSIGALMPTATISIGLTFTFFAYVVKSPGFEFVGVKLIAPTTVNERLEPFSDWLAACVAIGVYCRPIVVISWAIAVVNGIVCVGIRRFILRRQAAATR